MPPPTHSLKEELERIVDSSSDRDPGEVILELYALGDRIGHEVGERLLATHPELFVYRPVLVKSLSHMVNRLDIAEANRLLGQDFEGPVSFKDVASEHSVDLYNRLGDTVDHVDFGDTRKVVMVGCGPKPFTIFHIHDRTAVSEIVGLDTVPGAIETARALAAKLGYGRIRFELCDGRDYDYGETPIVYISSMVTPKAEVVSRIADTAPDNVLIIIWEPYSLGRLWAECAEEALDPRLEVTGRRPVSYNMTRDIFVRRRRRPASANVSR